MVINAKCQEICDEWDKLGEATQRRRQALENMVIVHSVDEIKGLIQAHEQFKATLNEAQKEKENICGLMREAAKIARQYGVELGVNPYTTVTSESIESAWQIVITQIPKRDSALQIELSKQQYHNQLRLKFAQQANAVGPWIQQKTEEIVGVALEMDGTLEQQIQKLKIYQTSVEGYRPKVEEL